MRISLAAAVTAAVIATGGVAIAAAVITADGGTAAPHSTVSAVSTTPAPAQAVVTVPPVSQSSTAAPIKRTVKPATRQGIANVTQTPEPTTAPEPAPQTEPVAIPPAPQPVRPNPGQPSSWVYPAPGTSTSP